MDMRFVTWNVRSLYGVGLLMADAKELSKYKLHLVSIQEVRWDRGGTNPTGEYTFFYGKGNENRLRYSIFIHKRIISEVKMVEFVSDRMSYIIPKGHWCDIIVLNVHAPTEDKIDSMKDRLYKELESVFYKFPKYHMKILLGGFNPIVDREDIYKPTIGNESSHEINSDNGVKVENFAISKSLTVESTMLPHRNIHEFTWTCPDGKTYNQIDHISINVRQHSSILVVVVVVVVVVQGSRL
ncbi:hypothetical protein B7P43_G09657 [Cryptotermes secundus]|uniref:Endonuclease/exonuclease/phosphatase domain-containing protein n=1 Tax=Cryptotermes secundus TaxID=105785 RepID=A0A2J7Q720_9NEOP|nr:hypothetical protein B7P43_G09657 [Cryptotermes secundus]